SRSCCCDWRTPGKRQCPICSRLSAAYAFICCTGATSTPWTVPKGRLRSIPGSCRWRDASRDPDAMRRAMVMGSDYHSRGREIPPDSRDWLGPAIHVFSACRWQIRRWRGASFMRQFIARRLGYSLVSLLVLSLTIFFFVRVTGDPASLLVDPGASEEDIAAIHQKFGLDKPIWTQYGLFMVSLFRGDLGQSF